MRSGKTFLLVASVLAVAMVPLLAGVSGATTTVHWGMNELTGGVMHADAGSASGTWEHITGNGASYLFNGVNSRVVVPDDDALDPGSADFSYSVVVSTDRVPDAKVGDYDLLRKGLASTKGGDYKVEIFPNSSHTKGRALCAAKGRRGAATLVGGPNLVDAAGHTITCKKTATTFSLWVDGVQIASRSVRLGSIANRAPLTIGAKAAAGGDWTYGRIGEVTITIG